MYRPSLSRQVILALFILALVSVSCGQPSAPVVGEKTKVVQPTAVEVTPVVKAAEATPTAVPTDTAAAAPTETATAEVEPTSETTDEPPAREVKYYEHMGVSLELPAELSEDVYGRIETGGYGDATIIGKFGPFPDAYVFSLEGYLLPEDYPDPQVMVIPVQAYVNVNAPASTQVEMLQDVLSSGVPNVDFEPFLPLWDSWENFTAHDTLLPFTSGQGLRYLTCMSLYNTEPRYIDSDCLFYTYQGLTYDGKYYVSAQLPVSLPVLDTQEMQDKYRAAADDTQNYQAYFQEAVGMIRAAGPDDFQPALGLLDELVQSVRVEPIAKLNPPKLPNYAVNCGTPKSHLRLGIGARVTFTDGAPLNVRENPGKGISIVAKLKEGTLMYIRQGPRCSGNGLWWLIETDAISGYVLEADGSVYFVEPVD